MCSVHKAVVHSGALRPSPRIPTSTQSRLAIITRHITEQTRPQDSWTSLHPLMMIYECELAFVQAMLPSRREHTRSAVAVCLVAFLHGSKSTEYEVPTVPTVPTVPRHHVGARFVEYDTSTPYTVLRSPFSVRVISEHRQVRGLARSRISLAPVLTT